MVVFRYHHVNTGLEPTHENIVAPVPYSQAVQLSEAARADEYAYHFNDEIGASGELDTDLTQAAGANENVSPMVQAQDEAAAHLSFFLDVSTSRAARVRARNHPLTLADLEEQPGPHHFVDPNQDDDADEDLEFQPQRQRRRCQYIDEEPGED